MSEPRIRSIYDLLHSIAKSPLGCPPKSKEPRPLILPFLELLTAETSATCATAVIFFSESDVQLIATDESIPRSLALNMARRLQLLSQQDLITGEVLETLTTQEELANLNLHGGALLPVVLQGRSRGMLWITGPEDFFTADELEFARRVRDAMAISALNLILLMRQQQYEAMIRQVLDTLDISVHITDIKSYEILYANRKLMDTWGFKEDIRGLHCWRVLQRQHEPCRFCPIPQLRINPDIPKVWERKNRVTGRIYRHSGHILQWLDGRPAYLQQSIDITRYRQATTSMRDALNLAEHAVQMKEELLNHMNQELHMSLNEILNMTSIASFSSDPATIQSCLDEINLATQHIMTTVSDALNLSRTKSERQPAGHGVFPVVQMAIRVLDQLTELWRAKDQRLQIYIAAGTPRSLVGNEEDLVKVLANLVSNAVKFTAEGRCIHLDIGAYPITGEPDRCQLQIQVVDTGIGIAGEFIPSLFNNLDQQRRGRRKNGYGLGLAVCRQLMTAMGGQILGSSHEDFGSTFTVTVPMEVAGEASDETLLTYPDVPFPAPGQLVGKGVLVIGDPAGPPGGLQRELASSGLDLALVDSGARALELIAANPLRFQLILLDRYLPDMEGYEVIRRVRDLCRPVGVKPPIVEMNPDLLTERTQNRMKLGIKAQIPKPVTLGRLSVYLFRYLLPDARTGWVTPYTKENVEMSNEFTLPEDLRDYVDTNGALERLRGNQKVYRTLLQAFLKNHSSDQLREHFDGGDPAQAAIDAHTIKGMAGNLSLTALFENAALLESQLKSGVATGESVQDFLGVWTKTREYVSMVLDALENGVMT